MQGRTHIIAAGYVTLMAYAYAKPAPVETGLILLASGIGTLLPDIDKRGSEISDSGVATGVAGVFMRIFTSHRGFTHTVIGAGIISALIAFLMSRLINGISPESCEVAGISIFTGMITHMILDTFNPAGIMWFWPFTRRRVHIARIRTGSIREKILAVVMLTGLILCILLYAYYIRG